MPPPSTKLRKREIAFALAMGVLAAGGGAAILSMDDPSGPAPRAVAAAPQTYDLADFDEITTTGPQDVLVTIGDSFSVRSEGTPQALGQLDVLVEDGRLVIRPGRSFRGDWGGLSSATYHVTLPRLDSVTLAGSGDIRVDRVEGDEFEGAINGSGELAIAAMQVDEADFSIGGSGDIVAAGQARETRISIGGRGKVEAAGLRSETANISIGGYGDVALTVSDEARVSIAGNGDVNIAGGARCSVSRFGSGDVTCNGVDID